MTNNAIGITALTVYYKKTGTFHGHQSRSKQVLPVTAVRKAGNNMKDEERNGKNVRRGALHSSIRFRPLAVFSLLLPTEHLEQCITSQ